LAKSSRDGDATHFKQLLQMKLKSHAKHQQDHAHFRKLIRQVLIRNKSGVLGPTTNPAKDSQRSEKVRPLSEVTEYQGRRQAAGKCQNQIKAMHQDSRIAAV
jgi:hypothetical protein